MLKIEKIESFLKKFIDKNYYTKIKVILSILFSIILALAGEYFVFRKQYGFISLDRIMIISLVIIFISIHFIFKLSEMYEWIHKNRYKIAGLFLLFVMIFKYSGSSIVNFNGLIQPNNDDKNFHEVLGMSRMIRTDEWATSTTYLLSQTQGEDKFNYFADKLRGTKTDMFTLINSPVYDILMLGKPFQLAFLLFGNEAGLSFYWYARIVAMMLGSYELCLILSNKKKKISLCGMLVITFSSAVQWWYCMDTLIWGQIILVLVNKFMIVNSKKKKYLCALGLVPSVLAYVFVLYPAWQVSFAYVFLALAIWIIIKNFKEGYKLTIHDVVVTLLTIVCIIALLGRWYLLSKDTIQAVSSTDYPGDRCETGGGAFNLYSYFYNIFFTFYGFPNPCEFSSMLSLFPIPMILGVLYLIRNKKNFLFWVPTLIIAVFLTIWCKFGFPVTLAKLTLMSNSQATRASIALGTLNIYMLIYLFSTFEKGDKWISKKLTYFLAVFATLFIMYKARKNCLFPEYIDKFKLLLGGEIFVALIFGVLNLNEDKIKNYTMYGLIGVALMSGLMVNPIIKTTDIIYKKPISIKMQEIRDNNPDAIWLVADGGWFINDYTVANGIRTINSTNVYPNLEMFKSILGDKAEQFKSTYNRYGHVVVNLVDTETQVGLLAPDCISLNLNYNDVSKLNVEYIVSREDLKSKAYNLNIDEVYNEDGLCIYKLEGK